MIATFFLALFLGAPPAEPSSAAPLRFEALLFEALEKNPALQAYEGEARAVLERADARAAFPDPVLGFSVHDLPVPSFSFREDMMTMSEAMVSQSFPWFGKRGLRRQSEGKGADVVASEQEAFALSLAQALAEAYADLWRLDRSRALLLEQRASLERLISLAGQGLSVGAGRQADVLMAEAEAAAIDERLATLEGEEVRARARLSALVSARGPLPGAPEELPSLAPPELGSLLEGLETHPELLAFEHRREALHLEADLARKEAMPDPEVSVAYGVRFEQPDMVGVGVRFALPVFGLSRADRLAAASRAEAQSVERRKKSRRDALEASLHSAHARVVSERERERLYEEEVIPRLRQSVRALGSAYVAGGGSLFAILEQERKIFDQELALLDARAAAFVAEVRLLTEAGRLDALRGGGES